MPRARHVVEFGADVAEAGDGVIEGPGDACAAVGGGLVQAVADALARAPHGPTPITHTVATTHLNDKRQKGTKQRLAEYQALPQHPNLGYRVG